MGDILGVVIAMVLSMLSIGGVVGWAKYGIQNVQTAAAAGQNVIFNKAAQQYVQDNGVVLAQQATATTPVTVNAATLVAGGYLPAGTGATNPFGQTLQVQILQPTPGMLQTAVQSVGGTAISDTKQLVQIAAQLGAQGGYVPYAGQAGDASLNIGTAYGAYGAWILPLAGTGFTNPGSGHIVSLLAFTNAQTNNSYLYRVAVPGHPELNTMQTALNMGGNDIANAANVTATGNVSGAGVTANTSLRSNGDTYLSAAGTAGAACGTPGSVRTSSTQTGLVICANGIWQPVGTAVANVTNGAPCSNNGQIATNGTNVGYLCRGNRYVSLSDSIGNLSVTRKIDNVTDGMLFPKDNCPGGTPWAIYTPRQFMVNDTGNVSPPIEGNFFLAVDNGATWYSQASGISAAGWYTGNDIAHLGGQLVGTLTTGCAY